MGRPALFHRQDEGRNQVRNPIKGSRRFSHPSLSFTPRPDSVRADPEICTFGLGLDSITHAYVQEKGRNVTVIALQIE